MTLPYIHDRQSRSLAVCVRPVLLRLLLKWF
jgi:hypothetical protein